MPTAEAPCLTDRPAQTTGSRDLVDIVSGSFGAGHDAAAREIASRLQDQGFVTRISDIVALMPGPLGRALRAGYLQQLQLLPAGYRWLTYYSQQREATNKLVHQATRFTERRLLELAADRPTVMISTHPMASQALGHLRATGRLQIPAVTYLTDMSVHRVWVHPHVDQHLALHELPAEQATSLGASHAQVVRPAVPPAFSAVRTTRRSQSSARRILGLPPNRRLILITGGSCGIGDLERSAEDIAATGVGTPVVLCGHNARLLRRMQANRSVVALGWTSNMPLVLEAVNIVVQNSGGFTSLETLAAGIPIVTYRCISGHGETNAAALDQAGMVPWIKHESDLAPALNRALTTDPDGPWSGVAQRSVPDVCEAVFSRPLLRTA